MFMRKSITRRLVLVSRLCGAVAVTGRCLRGFQKWGMGHTHGWERALARPGAELTRWGVGGSLACACFTSPSDDPLPVPHQDSLSGLLSGATRHGHLPARPLPEPL